MNRKSIDQTTSELQLHRVLYVIKLLRAMVLHVTLTAFAALPYFFAGISVYPVGTAFFQAIWALSIEHRPRIAHLTFVILLSLILMAVLALLVWMYRSITSVRRSALCAQAVLIVIMALSSIRGALPELQFAFHHLSLLFAALATLGVAMTMVVVPVSVALRMLGVARLQEHSSLVATLDPRLAPGFWVYVNKLLDLPRTPLRTAQTAGAYVLALAGAILMIASMLYLITVGGVSNKLSVLTTFRDNDLMREAIAHSHIEAMKIVFLLPCALGGVKLAALLQSTAKKLGGLSVSDLVKNHGDTFLLYLRPFDLDDVILPKPWLPLGSRLFMLRPYPVRIEEELFDVADGYRALVAVGKPGGAKAIDGGMAYRAFLGDSEWQGYVAKRIRSAERIVVVLKNTSGVRWEFERIIDEGAVSKTLFLFHPEVRDSEGWEPVEKMTVGAMGRAGVVPPDFAFCSRPIGFFFQSGELVEIANANWSATSYRTAFSYFLARRSLRPSEM